MSKNNILLTREQFKNECFKRDKHTCVFCSKAAKDAHHIIDRALWKDGGYYIDNAASVCEEHHWAVEKTNISVEDVRNACGITTVILPEGFDPTKVYDKWCNIILPNGRRLPGPMFFHDSVKKILKDKIWLFDF